MLYQCLNLNSRVLFFVAVAISGLLGSCAHRGPDFQFGATYDSKWIVESFPLLASWRSADGTWKFFYLKRGSWDWISMADKSPGLTLEAAIKEIRRLPREEYLPWYEMPGTRYVHPPADVVAPIMKAAERNQLRCQLKSPIS